MLMDNFQDFFMVLDEGVIIGYDCLIVWNYIDDYFDNILKEVIEELVEKFDIVELILVGVMGWFIGQRYRQLNGEKIEIIVKFDYECLI